MASETTKPVYQHPMISERAIDETRSLKVVYIGAGLSGIIAAILLPKLVPNIELQIYEKNEDVGGTWLENRYPGCACDVPIHTYQLSFESYPAWSQFYAGAPEILQYWQRVAEKYKVRRLMKFKHKCIEARWNETTSKWHIQMHDLASGQVFEEIADAFITGTGALNDWQWPEIAGLHDFKGKLLHSADWDETYDTKGKTIAVIGAGSSSIQIVPKLQPEVSSMDLYIRGPTWISTSFGHEMVRERNSGHDGNFTYSEAEKSAWASDPALYMKYRKSIELAMQQGYIATHRGTPQLEGARNFFESEMRRRLSSKPEIASQLIPSFSPFCKRLTPGPGYLEALTASNVNLIINPISCVTSTGITTSDGIHREVDTIVCATGFNTSFRGRIPTYGRNGVSLDARYTPRAEAYLTMVTDSFPNYFQVLGPNSIFVQGNFIVIVEMYHEYIAQILRRLSQTNIRSIEPKSSAVKGFADYSDAFFERTVFSEQCNSWFKTARTPGGDRKDGRVSGLWPGSCAHAMKALRNVRWEDFEIETTDQKAMGWLGNGFACCENQEGMEDELLWFLQDESNLLHKDLNLEGTTDTAEDSHLNAGKENQVANVDAKNGGMTEVREVVESFIESLN